MVIIESVHSISAIAVHYTNSHRSWTSNMVSYVPLSAFPTEKSCNKFLRYFLMPHDMWNTHCSAQVSQDYFQLLLDTAHIREQNIKDSEEQIVAFRLPYNLASRFLKFGSNWDYMCDHQNHSRIPHTLNATLWEWQLFLVTLSYFSTLLFRCSNQYAILCVSKYT